MMITLSERVSQSSVSVIVSIGTNGKEELGAGSVIEINDLKYSIYISVPWSDKDRILFSFVKHKYQPYIDPTYCFLTIILYPNYLVALSLCALTIQDHRPLWNALEPSSLTN